MKSNDLFCHLSIFKKYEGWDIGYLKTYRKLRFLIYIYLVYANICPFLCQFIRAKLEETQ